MLKATLAKIFVLAALLPLASAAVGVGHDSIDGPFWYNSEGRTNLHLYAILGHDSQIADHLALAEGLLNMGANPNVFDIRGETPLMNAARTNFVQMASLLITSGAVVNARSTNGWTAMDWAIQNSHTNMQRILRDSGGGCNRRC